MRLIIKVHITIMVSEEANHANVLYERHVPISIHLLSQSIPYTFRSNHKPPPPPLTTHPPLRPLQPDTHAPRLSTKRPHMPPPLRDAPLRSPPLPNTRQQARSLSPPLPHHRQKRSMSRGLGFIIAHDAPGHDSLARAGGGAIVVAS